MVHLPYHNLTLHFLYRFQKLHCNLIITWSFIASIRLQDSTGAIAPQARGPLGIVPLEFRYFFKLFYSFAMSTIIIYKQLKWKLKVRYAFDTIDCSW